METLNLIKEVEKLFSQTQEGLIQDAEYYFARYH